ncbi:MAG TPA: carboxypeptidase-like regulatory domain-containing protein [Holophagaceae bacterium]|nr:carboxypeptidase-like regulatory domain-containing protein [Holophagaceae bacterium]
MNAVVLLLCMGAQPAGPPVPALATISATTGGIKAAIQDGKQAPVAGVEIRLRHRDGRRWVATTDALGRFRAGGLPPGDYELSCHRKGFEGAILTIQIRANAWLLGVTRTPVEGRSKGARVLNLVGPALYEGGVSGLKGAPKAGLEKIPMH